MLIFIYYRFSCGYSQTNENLDLSPIELPINKGLGTYIVFQYYTKIIK